MTALVRNQIKSAYGQTDSVNPSLLLQKGLLEANQEKKHDDKSDNKKKTTHLEKIVKLPASPEYNNTFNRWFELTSDANRFKQSAMTLENRLLIGLTGQGALETGCSLSRNYGMPYIPGSSVKGVLRAWANQHLAGHSDELEQLFGTDDSEQPYRVSGLVTFHDAWWIPDPAKKEHKPFVLDVVTTHHQAYYNGTQAEPSDKDSPIPNHLLAVQGSFLFVLEGEPAAIDLCQTLLEKALANNGIGAKTAAGYGYMKVDPALMQRLLDEYEKRLSPEEREHREAEAQRRNEQQLEAAAKAELEMPPSLVISVINEKYQVQRDNQNFRDKVEAWIDRAIETWDIDNRKSLASCLKEAGYIPGKKKKNYQINKDRLQQLKGE
ncbi:type III-B CRISPR module RAMP protein Cmr6 [Vibrio cholerae]|uniref:type III-B CRISPR module RAMP protein Cmr6 n=1 Tax=Vibrio cholerae TaxID=666 RepID=UPI00053C6A2B|nr:type III-B CRISPR module RAMP protein Cmr6 [Vibrio cholerae]HAS2384503.1 type III-B CRISPR module RAMP protein Cmr6 [Vibrio cholerae O1]EGQ9632303.1 type III-B CRISPR module RAMP protein Cmr6 [Vibrio cholerae]EGR0028305.1 type III-B CRISPR module RAMP protein Cmr6 [Vibrio cholerae]EHE6948962.1 type III-B CRISPR module RAMP protein Cmr6 [Vibrio cholerae]EJI4015288.1 type III-B CRISPR module RAMP protein Cmr6 [Vibrio cholerae]